MPRIILVKEFIKWAGWTITEYRETPHDEVLAWWETWIAEVEHNSSKKPS